MSFFVDVRMPYFSFAACYRWLQSRITSQCELKYSVLKCIKSVFTNLYVVFFRNTYVKAKFTTQPKSFVYITVRKQGKILTSKKDELNLCIVMDICQAEKNWMFQCRLCLKVSKLALPGVTERSNTLKTSGSLKQTVQVSEKNAMFLEQKSELYSRSLWMIKYHS